METTFLPGAGETKRIIRDTDWTHHPLGNPESWPQSLRTTLELLMNSAVPSFLLWGPHSIVFYNDGFLPVVDRASRHPRLLTHTFHEVWPDADRVITSSADAARRQADPMLIEGLFKTLFHHEHFQASAVHDESGMATGVLFTALPSASITSAAVDRDVLDAKRKTELSERYLRLLILQAPVSIGIFRGPEHVVEIANARALQLWGRTIEQVIGKPILETMPELESQGIRKLLDDVYTTGTPFKSAELPVMIYRNGKNEAAYVNFTYQPLEGIDGNVDGIMAVGFEVTEQVMARQDAQESEERLRDLVESAPFPIGVYQGKEMRITLVNKSILNTWGKGYDVVGKTYAEVLPELKNQAVYEQLSEVYKTGVPFHAVNREIILMIDGKMKPFYFNYSFTPVFDALGNVYGVMNTAADVTDLNLAKKALTDALHQVEESEKRFRHVADSAPVLIWMSGTDKRGTFFNKEWRRFRGRTIDEELDDDWMQGVHLDDHARCIEIFSQSFDRREGFNLEYRMLRHDGEFRWISNTGAPRFTADGEFEGFIGACMDVHERVISRNNLRDNEEKLKIVVDASALGTWEYNLRTSEVTYSDRYTQIMGFDGQLSVSHKQLISRIHPEDTALRHAAFASALETGVLQYELRVLWDDRSVHWIDVRGKVFYDGEQQPEKLVGTVRDITAQKTFANELERQVAARTRELEKKNHELGKMNEELKSFAYVSSHDLQEPLRKIQTFSSRIREKEADNLSDSGKDYFARMEGAALRMQTLIEDLLTYSRTSTAERTFEEVDLNAIVAQVIHEWQEDIQLKGARIESHVGVARVVPFQIKQLLHNLIGNALKFSRAGIAPRITIEGSLINGKESGVPGLLPERDYYHLAIADNGIGFDPQYKERIFEVFQRLHTRSAYKGTGIGLAIVKKIVDNHDGVIFANGAVNAGARFDIYLLINEKSLQISENI